MVPATISRVSAGLWLAFVWLGVGLLRNDYSLAFGWFYIRVSMVLFFFGPGWIRRKFSLDRYFFVDAWVFRIGRVATLSVRSRTAAMTVRRRILGALTIAAWFIGFMGGFHCLPPGRPISRAYSLATVLVLFIALSWLDSRWTWADVLLDSTDGHRNLPLESAGPQELDRLIVEKMAAPAPPERRPLSQILIGMMLLPALWLLQGDYLNPSHLWRRIAGARVTLNGKEAVGAGIYRSREGTLAILLPDSNVGSRLLYGVSPSQNQLGVAGRSGFYPLRPFAYESDAKVGWLPSVNMDPELVVRPNGLEFTLEEGVRVVAAW
jgi:hypothetical protein